MLARIGSTLLRYSDRWPRSAAFGVGGLVGGLGDAVAQKLEATDAECDGRRVGAMALYNASFAALVYIPFYRALDVWFGATSTVRNVLQKTAMDQFVMVPAFDLPAYFAVTGLLEGNTVQQVKASLSNSYRDTLLGTWAIYIPIQIVNFSIVPLSMRVPIAYAADIVCCALYSHLSHRTPEQPDTGAASAEAASAEALAPPDGPARRRDDS